MGRRDVELIDLEQKETQSVVPGGTSGVQAGDVAQVECWSYLGWNIAGDTVEDIAGAFVVRGTSKSGGGWMSLTSAEPVNPEGAAEPIEVRLHRWRDEHRRELRTEMERLTRDAATLGVERVVLFGSAARGEAGLTSDLDLLMVWDTDLGFVERTAALYARLQLTVACDLLVYTPSEMGHMAERAFVRRVLAEGRELYAR